MVERRPLVIINGGLQQLPVGDDLSTHLALILNGGIIEQYPSESDISLVDPLVMISGSVQQLPSGDTLLGIPEAVEGAFRYWRLFGTETQHATNYALHELEMHESIGGANVATTGFTIHGTEVETIENAFDESNTTRAIVSDASGEPWMGQDFGAGNEKAIREIELIMTNFEFQGFKGFRFEYSEDGTTWTTAFEISGEANWPSGLQSRTYTIPPVTVGAAPELISSTTANDAGDVTIAYPASIAEDDLLVLICMDDRIDATNDWTTPAGWALHISAGTSLSDSSITIFSKLAAGTETGNLTAVRGGSQDAGAVMLRITGADTTSPMEVIGTPVFVQSNTIVIPSITTLSDNALVIAMVATDGNDAVPYSWPAGFTEIQEISRNGTAGFSFSCAQADAEAAGAIGTTTVGGSTSDGNVGLQISIKAA